VPATSFVGSQLHVPRMTGTFGQSPWSMGEKSVERVDDILGYLFNFSLLGFGYAFISFHIVAYHQNFALIKAKCR
jgi:hypothetical protein